MNPARRLVAPTILICALLAALALAATASAEIRVGEKTVAPDPSVAPEADIIGARAEYDSTTGSVVFQITTAAAPQPLNVEGEENESQMLGGLFSPRNCTPAIIGDSAYPLMALRTSYAEGGRTFWELKETSGSIPKAPETEGPATKVSAGTTTTLSVALPKVANQEFSCAVVGVIDPLGPAELRLVAFPIAVPPPPAPPAETTKTTTAPPSQTGAPPPPAPPGAALSIARSKALTLKEGKWKTVKVKVTNMGGSASAPGSLRLKAPKGVAVKPLAPRLPALPAGGSWVVSARVKLTETAKAKSTIALTAAAGGITAKGSLVLTRQD
jgi:hypothetical protein